MKNSTNLQNLEKQHSTIRDRIRGVALGHSNGMYLHGPPGSSKSYLVRTTLDQLGVPYSYSPGCLTPIGLFELIEENLRRVILLDDVTESFKHPLALQILLAALGNPHDGSRVRVVRYKKAGVDRQALFEGGIISISNLPLSGHNKNVLAALNDRIHVVAYDPTDDQLKAQILHVASAGTRHVVAKDALMVARYLLEEIKQAGLRPTLRLLVDKALPDFAFWKSGNSECHWKDLVRSSVQQQIVAPTHEIRNVSRQDRLAAERRVALEIYGSYPTHKEREAAWKERMPSSSVSSYNRRVGELRKEGRLVSGAGNAA